MQAAIHPALGLAIDLAMLKINMVVGMESKVAGSL